MIIAVWFGSMGFFFFFFYIYNHKFIIMLNECRASNCINLCVLCACARACLTVHKHIDGSRAAHGTVWNQIRILSNFLTLHSHHSRPFQPLIGYTTVVLFNFTVRPTYERTVFSAKLKSKTRAWFWNIHTG